MSTPIHYPDLRHGQSQPQLKVAAGPLALSNIHSSLHRLRCTCQLCYKLMLVIIFAVLVVTSMDYASFVWLAKKFVRKRFVVNCLLFFFLVWRVFGGNFNERAREKFEIAFFSMSRAMSSCWVAVLLFAYSSARRTVLTAEFGKHRFKNHGVLCFKRNSLHFLNFPNVRVNLKN